MEFAFQVPIPHLRVIQGDFDYALAHLILQGGEYTNFYKEQRQQGRKVFLDNGVHERGEPLSMAELMKAANMINPSFLIPPDWLFEMAPTVHAAKIAASALGPNQIAPVVQGRTIEELRTCYNTYVSLGFETICIPYRVRELRFELIQIMQPQIFHHFLGLNYLKELQILRNAPNPSLDTGKPLRYAQLNYNMEVGVFRKKALPKLDMNAPCNLSQAFRNISLIMKEVGREG